jgi:hypothetical protein
VEPIDEITDGPDLLKAQAEVRDARDARRRTDEVVKRANIALLVLRGWHDENHFTDKLREAIRSVPS